MIGYFSGRSGDPAVASATFGGASVDTDKLFEALTDHVVATKTRTPNRANTVYLFILPIISLLFLIL
jgi:hypothetical protein